MKLVEWTSEELGITMSCADTSTMLVTTTAKLAEAFQVTPQNLRSIALSRPEDFSNISVNSIDANNAVQFFEDNREAFGFKRVRLDSRLWTDNDWLTFAILLRSDRGRAIRKQLIEYYKSRAIKVYVDRFEKVVTNLQTQLGQQGQQISRLMKKERLADEARAAEEKAASAAGAALNAHKGTKAFREGIN